MQDNNDSILIPKIEVNTNQPTPPQETTPDFMKSQQETPGQSQQAVQNPVQQSNTQTPMKKPKSRNQKIFLGIGIFLAVLIVATIIPGIFLFFSGKALAAEGQNIISIAQSGNVDGVIDEIPNLKKSLNSFERSYKWFSWTKVIPYFGGYTKDLGHGVKAAQAGVDAGEIVLTTLKPYMDVFGFTNAATGEQTTQERIDFVLKAIPDILPKIDDISSKLEIVNSQVAQINADHYPQMVKGMEVRNKIKDAQDLTLQVTEFIVNGKPVLEAAPYLLGVESPREYLILFQNDKELRPTGGFMTAYSIMKVDKAAFEPVSSDDIYHLDAVYKPTIDAPSPLVKYLKGPYILSPKLRLRDMNWSPDFANSMKTTTEAVDKAGVNGYDGVIAVDTKLLENILDVIGPIGVPGFGNFSTEIIPECNCPQVIHELESFADNEGPVVWDPNTGEIVFHPPNFDNRKKIIGPLMNSVLANALGQPKEKLPALFDAVFRSLTEKHVLFYMFDDASQKALSDFGFGGVVKDYEGDYLHINDANLGGRKSNLYVTQEVMQEINVARDGTVEKTLTLTYKNPEKQDGWLNSVLPNWVRVYVPKGSQLVSVEGLEDKTLPYEDLGKTVFAGLFKLRPEGVSKVTFKYNLPFKVTGKEYMMLIQKQSGTDSPLYMINLGKNEEEFFLKTDKELKIRI